MSLDIYRQDIALSFRITTRVYIYSARAISRFNFLLRAENNIDADTRWNVDERGVPYISRNIYSQLVKRR